MNKDYIFVYFHSETVSDNLLDSSFLKELYSMVDRRYTDNLRAMYIVHPNWWLKASHVICDIYILVAQGKSCDML